MAKNFWEDDKPATTEEFWKDDRPSAKRDLPAGVTPSTAGAGRGRISLADMVRPDVPQNTEAQDQQVVTSARRWNGAASGRGTINDPRRLDTTGQSVIDTETELDRLAQINAAPRESLRAFAEHNVSQPSRIAPPVDRVKQYTDKGMGLKDAQQNADFDANLQTRLNRPFQQAAPDERGDRIKQGYNPNTDAAATAAKQLEVDQAQESLQIRANAEQAGPVATGLARGFGQSMGFGQAAIGFAGDLFGSEQVKQWGIEGYKDTMRNVGAMTLAKDFTDLKTPEDVGTYVAETLSYGAVQSAQAVLSGGIGGLLGKSVGKEVVGQIIGMATTNVAQEIGSIYGDAQEEAKRTGKAPPPLWQVATGAIVAASIDTFADKFGMDSVAKEGFRGAMLSRITKSVASQFATQGGTEMAQKVPEEWGAGKDPFRKGMLKEYINEGAAGALMGGGPGVMGGIKSGNPNDIAARALADQLNSSELPGAKPSAPPVSTLRPVERLRAANDRLDDFAATHGVPTKAVDAIKKALDGKPVDQVAGFVKRAIQGLASRGLVSAQIDETHLGQLDEPAPAQDVRAAMDSVLALEQAAAEPTRTDVANTPAEPAFDPGNDLLVTPGNIEGSQDVGTGAQANPVDSGTGGQLGDNAAGSDSVRGRVPDNATGPGADTAGTVLADGQQDAPVRTGEPEQPGALSSAGPTDAEVAAADASYQGYLERERDQRRKEDQDASSKQNAWAKRATDWFSSANDGDSIEDSDTGVRYVVHESVKERKGQRIVFKGLFAINADGTETTTGITMRDGVLQDVGKAGLDEDGIRFPTSETFGTALGLGKGIEDGTHKTSRNSNSPAEAQAAPSEAPASSGTAAAAEAVPAAPGSAPLEAAGIDRSEDPEAQAIRDEIRAGIDSKNGLAFQTQGDGTVRVGAVLKSHRMITLEMTPSERKAWNKAQALDDLAETLDERAEARKAVQVALRAPTLRATEKETPTSAPVEAAGVAQSIHYGINHIPMTEGGKAFKTEKAAKEAKKLQPMMRVKKVKGGYVLTEKTPAQIAAQARAAGRLAAGSTGDAGIPQHAHGFMAREGGLSKSTMKDLGFDKNQRVGSLWMFKADGGMSLEQATEKLIEGGYLKEGASHSDAIDIIKKSVTNPQYTADGWDRIAQAEADARFEDHLAAQEEAAQNDDFDPFESLSAEGFTAQDDELAGYSEASDPIKLQVNADIANAETLGIDIDELRESSYEATKNGSEQDYLEHLSNAIAQAITRSEENRGNNAGQQSNQASQAEHFLASPTREDILAKQQAEEDAAKAKESADKAQDEADRAARIKKEIDARQAASAENFTLGQSAEDALAGQGDIFSQSLSSTENNGSGNADADSLLSNQDQKDNENTVAGTPETLAPALANNTELAKPAAPAKETAKIEDIGVIQTKEDEFGNVAMFAKGDGLDAFRASLSKLSDPLPATDPKVIAKVQAWTDELSAKWGSAPDIRVVASSADLPVKATSDTRGLYYRGTVYVVAGRVGSKRAVGEVLAHESVAHYGLREMLGKDDWQRFMGNIQLAIKSGNKPLNAIRDEIRSVYVDENGKPNLTPDEEADEIAARVVEKAIDANGEFKPGFAFIKSVYAKIVQFLRDIGLNVQMTHLELQGALINAQRYLEAGNRTAGGGQMVVAAAREDAQAARNDQTKTPEFKAWFGGSEVVDADGNPLVMYHGTTKDFSSFDNSKRGQSTGHATALLGDYFSADAGIATDFIPVDHAWGEKPSIRMREGGNIMPVYLSIKNPYQMHVDEFRSLVDRNDSQEVLDLQSELIGKGYDGVYVRGDASLADTMAGSEWGGDTWISFKPTQVKSATGNNGQFDPTNPDIRYARGEPTAPDSFGAPMAARQPPQQSLFQPNIWSTPDPTTMDKWIYEIQDAKVDLKRVQQAITKAGNTIAEKWNARLAETLYPGRVAHRSQLFLDSEVKPLLSAMALNKMGMDELADYLHARGAPERNAQIAKVNPSMPDGGAGKNTKGVLMTNAAARAYIAAISPTRLMVLDAMAKRVDSITSGTRSLLVTEGLEKQSTIDAWNGAYQHYVPMFRDEADDGFPSHPQGSGFAVKGSASKRATGSTKEVTNILAHVLMQREAAITRAEKNRVAVSLYGLALSHPNPEFWTTIKPSMSAAAIGSELTAMGVDPMTAQVGMEGVPTIRTVDPNTGKVVDRPNPMYKNLPTAIPLKLNGEDRVLMLSAKNARSLRMAESLKNLDGLTQFDLAGSIVGKSTRWIASVNTQYNPAFGLVNFTRDTMGGAVNLGSTELRGKALKVLANSLPAIWGIARELASNGGAGKWSKLYRQFVADGGQTGYRENWRDPNDRAAAIEKEIKALGRAKLSPSRAAHAILDLLDGFNTTLENAVRVSAYSAALDKGISRPEAARLGRELTVDFNRKGRATREVGPLYAFFNASVQGSARTVEAIKGPTGAAIILGGLSLGLTQALMLAMAGYDDDELPEFIKTRSLVIPLNWSGIGEKKHILIPYPLGLHVIPNTGRVLADLTLNGGKNIVKRSVDAVGEIAAAFNPLGGGNIFTADGALKTVAPTVVDPLIELGFNKNFSGTPIEKQSYGGETDNRPGVARAKETTQRSMTGQAYIGISKAINSMTGGTDYEAGKISPTPERVRYLAQVVGGGVLRELEKSINAADLASRGEKVNPGAVPITGRFYGEVDRDRVDTSRYYEAGKKIKQAESSLKAMKKTGDDAAMDKFEDAHPEVRLIREYNKVSRSVSKLNAEAVQTIGNPAELKQIDADRLELMRDLNLSVRELEDELGRVTLADKLNPTKAAKVAKVAQETSQ